MKNRMGALRRGDTNARWVSLGMGTTYREACDNIATTAMEFRRG